MKRADIILAEARKKKKRKSLSAVRTEIHNASQSAVSQVSESSKSVLNTCKSGDEGDNEVSEGRESGQMAVSLEKRQIRHFFKVGTTRLRRNNTVFQDRATKGNKSVLSKGIPPKVKKVQLKRAVLKSARRAEQMTMDSVKGVRVFTRNTVLMVKLAAKSILALFTALLVNLSTVLITVVISVVVVVSVLSVFLSAWFREDYKIDRAQAGNYYVSELTLEEYMETRTNQWRDSIMQENTEGAWYVVWHGNGRIEFEPDWDGCLAEFDEWLGGKYLPGEVISEEDIQVLDGILVKYSDYVVTVEYFDFYEFDSECCDGVFDIRDEFAREEIGSKEWFKELDYMQAFWSVEEDGERKLWVPAVVVKLKR